MKTTTRREQNYRHNALVVEKYNVKNEVEKTMNHLAKLLTKFRRAKRNHSFKGSLRKGFGNRLSLERLEERSLMAVVAAWSAENTAVDSAGGNNGTLFNGANYVAGQMGQAFSLDGINDRINVADSPSLKLTQSLTIEGWIKVNAAPTLQGAIILFRGDDRGGLDPYQLSLQPGAALKFQVQSLTETASVSTPVPIGQFVHVAATLDHRYDTMSIYLNGTLMSQITTAVRPFGDLDLASNPGIGIGSHGGYPTTPHNFLFNGLIDELKVYDHALAPDLVLAHFNVEKGSFQPTISISDSTATEGETKITLLDRFVKDGSGGLITPRQLTFGPDGNADNLPDLYVASVLNNSILRYDGLSGAFLDVFVPAGSGGLNSPGDLIFDSNKNFFVTSVNSNQLLKYDSTGTFVGVVASGLNRPYGLEFAADGSLLIADAGSDRILKVNGSIVTSFVGTGSQGLNEPRNVSVGPDGDLYVVSQLTASILKYDGNTGAPKGVFASNPSGGQTMWAEFGSDGHLYASYRTSTNSNGVTIARFNVLTGTMETSLDTGRDSWSFIVGPNNTIYNGGNGGGNYVDRFVIAEAAAFTLSLNAPSPNPISVSYETADGTALGTPSLNADYVSSGLVTVTFAPGEFTKRIIVRTLDNSTLEGTENFFINLSTPVGATIADSQGVATILDKESPPTKFYVVDDASTNKTFEYAAKGSALENYSLSSGNTAPRGAASTAAGDTVWVVDANKKVYVYSTSGGPMGSWSLGSLASNATVEGITTNGTDVWIVDSRSDKVFKYAGAATRTSLSQNATSSFPLNGSNTSPTDLVTDGASIWVLNNTPTTDKVFKYGVDGSSLGNWTITSGGGSPTGLTIDPTNVNDIWIVDNNTDRVYQFNSATIHTNGSASPSSSFALAVGNTNPQGIADPPTPASMLASPSPRVALGKSITEVEKPSRKSVTSSNPFLAQADSIFENWNEDSMSGQTKKRLADFALAAGNINPQGIADPPPPGNSVPLVASAMAPLMTSKAIDSAFTQLSDDFVRNRLASAFEMDRATIGPRIATPRSEYSTQQSTQPAKSENRVPSQSKRLTGPTDDIFSHWNTDVLNDFDL